MDDLARPERLAELQAMDGPALREALGQLEARGAARRTALPFLLAQSLAARLDEVTPAVAALLRARMAAAIADCESTLDARRTPRPGAPARATRRSSPLAALNTQLATEQSRTHGAGPAAAAAPELASATRFRQALARQQALERIDHAQGRRPRNAGPLNSHAIALECLSLMRTLSPAYLHHFIEQVEALQLLEHWQGQPQDGPSAGLAGAKAPARRAGKARPGPRARGKG